MERRYILIMQLLQRLDLVVEAMLPYFSQLYGNPSSVYELLLKIKKALDEARSIIARCHRGRKF